MNETTTHKKAKNLFGNIGLFAMATFLPKALMFIMLPIYTGYLGTDEYGAADLINTTVSLLLPILTLQVQDAVLRFAINKEYDEQDIFTVAVRIVFSGGFLLIAGVMCLNWAQILVDKVLLLFICINYLTGALNNISAYFMRGINRVRAITVGSILDALITVLCNILFLIVFKWGLYGYLVANSIGAVCKIVYYFFRVKLYTYIKRRITNRKLVVEMIKISIPMIFSALAWWVNNASDKYILRHFCTLSVVGVYAVASKIPTILASFGDVIAKAYSISAIKEYDEEDADGFLGKSYEMISFVMLVICSVLMMCNIFLADILFSKDFYEAWIFVPPLLISVMMNQFSESCTNIILAIGKTALISYGAVAGALINTMCNFLFIPHWGAYGAAIATIIGFGAAWQIKYHGMRRYIHIKHNGKREVLAIVLVLIQMFMAYWGNKYWLFQALILTGIIGLYYKEVTLILKKIRKGKSY